MDAVHITASTLVRDGLDRMLTAAIGAHEYLASDYVEAPIVLLVIEIARRAEDRPDWFPRGKWATIQSMQAACDHELGRLFPST